MYLVTSNEKNTLTRSQRRHDAEVIYDSLPQEPIVLWQEIKTAEDHEDIQSVLPNQTQYVFGPDSSDPNGLPIPISVPARYRIQGSWFLRTKENTADVYDVGSAERYYSVVHLSDTTKLSLPSFYIVNTHFTNGCEWEKDRDECSDQARVLRSYWTAHWNILKTEIDYIKDTLDSTVFYGGDANRKNWPPFGESEQLAVGDGRIDKLAVISRSVDVDLQKTGTVITLSDHDAHWANWSLTKRPTT